MIQNTVRWHSDWLDGAVVAHCLGTPGQTKVSGDRQNETTQKFVVYQPNSQSTMIKMNHHRKNSRTKMTVISELRWKSVPTNGHSTVFFEVILPLAIASKAVSK